MTLSKEQLTELTSFLNDRLDEFELVNIPTLTRGVVRVIHEGIWEWEGERPAGEAVAGQVELQELHSADPYADAFDGYVVGYQRGREDMRREMSPAPKGHPDEAKDRRLVTNRASDNDNRLAGINSYGEGYRQGWDDSRASLKDELGIDLADAAPPLSTLVTDYAAPVSQAAVADPDPDPDPSDAASVSAAAASSAASGGSERAGGGVIVEPPRADTWTSVDQAAWHDELVAEGIDPYHPDPNPVIADLMSAPVGSNDFDLALQAASNEQLDVALELQRPAPVSPTAAATAAAPNGHPARDANGGGKSPENVVVTPLRSPIGPSRDAALDGIEGGGNRSFLWQVIDALREMAEGGRMPSKGHWERNRPDTMPTSDAVLSRLKLNSWGDLAARATLTYNHADQKKWEFDEIVALLREWAKSDNGKMVTMLEWDRRKPDHLPKATLLEQRHNVSWGDLAGIVKPVAAQKPKPKRGRPRKLAPQAQPA